MTGRLTGRLAEGVLAVLLGEAVVLALRRTRTNAPPMLPDIAASLGAGAFLCLALRAEARQRPASRIAVLLVLAGLAHAADLRCRLATTR
ncbi:hypothetical protein NFI95_03415 [Acetobacteraceae bacterium KSS8]|uniref:Uncharacterized protein n=1 Tax=Endosaccharibacter trunci TaxID=2812733 RepID=A0ABT1W3Q1_9PROT|nr:hypothetical protein [Acetobacteraceae bacterium KSS8]